MASKKPKQGYKLVKSRFGKYDEIPEDWSVDEIQSHAKIETGDKNTQDKIKDGKYPFFVRSKKIERINSYSYDGEAVLTAGDGDIGKIFHYINGKFDFHQRVYKISDFDKKLNGSFFYHYFSKSFLNRAKSMSAKNTVDSIRLEMITKMHILLPPIQEQNKITSILSCIEGLIFNHVELLKKNILLKNSTLNEIIIHGFKHDDFKHVSLGRNFLQEEISTSWDVKKLRDIATVKGRIGWKNLRLDEYTDSGPMMLSVWSMPDDTKFGIDYSKGFERLTEFRYKESPEIQLQNDDILLSKDGANIGKVGIVKNLPELATVNSHIAVIKPKKDLILSDYLYWYLKSIYFQKYCRSSITGTGTPGFSQDNIRKSSIPLPTFIEQKKISNLLFNFEQKISMLSHQTKYLKNLKKGLMQKLLTGQIRV